MYDSFYRVAENPFKICTDPRFLWCSEKHSRVLSSLIYGLMDHNGLVVLTGDIGTGKTTLVNALLKILGTDVYVSKIGHPSLGAVEFLTLVAKSLDPNFTGTDKSDLLLFFDSFFRRVHAEGKIVLLIIDEAQHLSMELLEEIRLLSNMEQAGQRILSIMLVGQTELKPLIESPQSRSLRQRVTLFCEIQALTEEETPLYVEYRLKVSGLREQLFTSRAMQMIHTFSQGNPRLINILCDRAMRIGYMKKHKKIDAEIIIECARDMKLCNRVKVKVFELFGPDLLTWRQELSVKLKKWLAAAGPTLHSARTWLRHQGEVTIPQIRSLGRAFIDKLTAVSGRLIKTDQDKPHPSVWMAGIGLIAIVLIINSFQTTHDKRHPGIAAAKPDTPAQWTAPAGSGNAQWENSEKTPENPTMLVSTSPSASRLWYREPARQATVADRQPEPESLNPTPQPTTRDPEPTPAQLAALALEHKDYQKALELLKTRRNAGAEENRKTAELYADALLGRALEIMATSPYKAEAMLLRAIDVAPDNAKAYLTLGKYHTRTKKYAQAIDAYRHAIHLDPNLSDALFNLGFVYATTGKLEDAETAFSEAVQLKPPYLGKSLFNLAVVQHKLGKKEQGLANLEKAVAMMPRNEKALAYLNRLKHSATDSGMEQAR